MNDNDIIRQIGFEQVKGNKDIDYIDDAIAIHTDIREMPVVNGSMQMDMMAITICTSGKLQAELNTVLYTIHNNEVLICLPNTIIDNCMVSPDFSGTMLCLSQRGIMEQIPGNELWNSAFHYAKNPIIHISDESRQMLKLYSTILLAKIKQKEGLYYKKIISSIANVVLYELMGNIATEPEHMGDGIMRQRDVLFKRFLKLLSTTQIRSRNVL